MTNIFRVMFYICIVSIEYLATTTREIEIVSSMWDKSNHFIAFFTLYILLTLGYKNMKLSVKVLSLMAFAVQIEIVQHFIDGRFFSLLDVVADFVGIILGIFVMRLVPRVKLLVNY